MSSSASASASSASTAAAASSRSSSSAAAAAAASSAASASAASASSSSAAAAAASPELASFVALLRSRHIRCVCFDMDRTLVSMHSGGSVAARDVAEFAASLTPASRALIPLLVAEGIHVAVATFADDLYSAGKFGAGQVSGVPLVQRVLSELACFRDDEAALARVPIATLNPDLYSKAAASKIAAATAAAEEQRKMKSAGAAAAASKADELHNFFLSKVSDFGIAADHASWPDCIAFPPQPFKNHHLLLIAAKLDLPLHSLILLDDRDENVEAAIEAGAHGLFLQQKKGLITADFHERNVRAPNAADLPVIEDAVDWSRFQK